MRGSVQQCAALDPPRVHAFCCPQKARPRAGPVSAGVGPPISTIIGSAMNGHEFVSAIVEHVHRPAIEDLHRNLESPLGRRPKPRATALSVWYGGLAATDKEHLREVMELAVHSAIFGTLCVLDGVRTVATQTEVSEFVLLARGKSTMARINDQEGESLHDIYQGLIYKRVFGEG